MPPRWPPPCSPTPRPAAGLELGLLTDLGKLQLVVGATDPCLATLATAATLCEGLEKSQLHRRRAVAYVQAQAYSEALAALDQAETALVADAGTSLAHQRERFQIALDRAKPLYWAGRVDALGALIEQLSSQVNRGASPAQQTQFHLLMQSAINRQARYAGRAKALEHAEAARRAARDSGDLQTLGEATFMTGFQLLHMRRWDAARERLQAAADLAARRGDVWLELRAVTYQGLEARFGSRLPLMAALAAGERTVDGLAEARAQASFLVQDDQQLLGEPLGAALETVTTWAELDNVVRQAHVSRHL